MSVAKGMNQLQVFLKQKARKTLSCAIENLLRARFLPSETVTYFWFPCATF